MNQARGGRYFVPEDFEEKAPLPWIAIIAGVIAVALFCSAAFFYGARDGYRRGYAAGNEAPKLASCQCSTLLDQCARERIQSWKRK